MDAERRVFGSDHPETLTAIHNLATTYDELGSIGEAEKQYLGRREQAAQ